MSAPQLSVHPDYWLVVQAKTAFEFSLYGGKVRHGPRQLGDYGAIGEPTRERAIDKILVPLLKSIKHTTRIGRNQEEIADLVKRWAGPLGARGLWVECRVWRNQRSVFISAPHPVITMELRGKLPALQRELAKIGVKEVRLR